MDTELEQKPAVGCPTLYNRRYCKPAKALCQTGYTLAQLADYFNVTVGTIIAWKNRYPEFAKAIEQEARNADEQIVQSLYSRAKGCSVPDSHIAVLKDGQVIVVPTVKHYPPDTQAAALWLRNRKSTRKEWSQGSLEQGQDDPMASLAVRLARELAGSKAGSEHSQRLSQPVVEVKAEIVVDQPKPEMIDGDGI